MPLQFSSGKRYLINTKPEHKDGSRFRQSHEVPGTSLIVHTQLNSMQIADNAKKLLQHCGIDPSTVQLQVGQ